MRFSPTFRERELTEDRPRWIEDCPPGYDDPRFEGGPIAWGCLFLIVALGLACAGVGAMIWGP